MSAQVQTKRTRSPRRRTSPARVLHRFEPWEGPQARSSYRSYFDRKRAAQGRPPMQIVEVNGRWCAIEPVEASSRDEVHR